MICCQLELHPVALLIIWAHESYCLFFMPRKRMGIGQLNSSMNMAKELKYIRPGGFHHLGQMKLGSSQIDNIDFSYREVSSDLCSYFQEIHPSGAVLTEQVREVFRPDFLVQPSTTEIYGFAGQVMPEMHGTSALVTQMHVYPGLKFIGTEDQYHVFEFCQHPIPAMSILKAVAVRRSSTPKAM